MSYEQAIDQIKATRLKLGLSQAEAAERAGIHQASWSAYELGRKMPSVSMLDRLAGALDRQVEYRLRKK